MRFDELLGDGEPEPGAARLGGLVEAVEDAAERVRRDTRARVGDDEHNLTVVLARVDAHPAAPRRIAKRVRDEVREDLPSADRIGVREREVRRRIGVKRDPGLLGLRLERRDRFLRERREIGRLAMERECAGLGERERPQILDEPRKHLRLVEDREEMLFVGRVHPVDECLEVSLDDRERGAQLVADIGEQAPPLLLARTKAAGHRVEGACERASFTWTALVDAR